MNIQEIIVFIIIGVAVFFTIRKLVKKLQNPSQCDGCSATSCGGCEVAKLKKEIEDKNKTLPIKTLNKSNLKN